MKRSLLITSKGDVIADCVSIIIVPEIAIAEAGYIKMFTVKDAAHAKHEYHAMAQMAYFQYQDEELVVKSAKSAISINCGDEDVDLEDGLVICREQKGEFYALILTEQKVKKILEAAYRYCTRWIRLDI